MEHSNSPESGNLSAFVAGALMGAGVALLFAPRGGSEMRRLLRDYVERAQKELANDIDRGAEALDRAVQSGQGLMEKGKEAVRETGRHAKTYADEWTSQHR
jgi:gas vesicle protein